MGKRVIIYAEDGRDQRETMEEVLRLLGYEVHAHQNGKLALEDIKQRVAKGEQLMLLTDNNMPVMTGVELVKALADAGIRIPTVMQTADDNIDKQLAAAGVADRIDEQMAKAVDLMTIRSTIDKWGMVADTPRTVLDFAGRHEGSFVGRR